VSLATTGACSRLEPTTASPAAGKTSRWRWTPCCSARPRHSWLTTTCEDGSTGDPGGRIAAAYLAAECHRLGLQPLGDSYHQELPISQATIVPEGTSFRITGPGVDTTFAYYDDFIPDVGAALLHRGGARPSSAPTISSPGLGGRSIVSPGSSISTATRRRPVPSRGAWRERKEARWWSWCATEFAAAVVRRLDDGASGPLAAGPDYRRVESSLTGPGGIR